MVPYYLLRTLLFLSVSHINRTSIQTYYCSIICWVLLHDKFFIRAVTFLAYIIYNIYVAEPGYCMDPFSDLSTKIAKCEDNIKYFSDQSWACHLKFGETLSSRGSCVSNGQISQWEHDYAAAYSALADSKTNLDSEERMLNILKQKLHTNNNELPVKSIIGKRKNMD